MKLIDNVNSILKDDLIAEINQNDEICVVASCFSIYAFEELKSKLKDIKSFKFIFSSPTFTDSESPKEFREFYIPQIQREHSIHGASFEIRLKNELNQKAISEECSKWIEAKCEFRSNNANTIGMPGFVLLKNKGKAIVYMPINGFTTAELGCRKGGDAYYLINKNDDTVYSSQFKTVFDSLWNDKSKVEDVKEKVLSSISSAYTEKSPEFIYFFSLFNLFKDYLEETTSDDLPNESTGFRKSEIWNSLYDFQKDAALGIIQKLEKYNGCILADSVGLGKTYTALAVIKYYENRNKSVLVLCPKKLSENWNTFKGNYKNNPLLKDRFAYDVLFHTDLSREHGLSNGMDLSRINWENYDLIVIDESHNFRNGVNSSKDEDGIEKDNRYKTLLNKVLKQGVKTKVLMLSATPVNNRFYDLRNQIALAYEGNASEMEKKLKLKNKIDDVFRFAQTEYNSWSKLPQKIRTTKNLINRLSFDFFKILDSVTIARSRKHIRNYYSMINIGEFPNRLSPISFSPNLCSEQLITYEEIYVSLSLLNLKVYTPSFYLFPSKIDKYEKKGAKGLTIAGREIGIQKLMQVNLLKRLESSAHSFELTLKRIYNQITATIKLIEEHLKKTSEAKISIDVSSYGYDFDSEDQEREILANKRNIIFDLADLDCKSWMYDLSSDQKVLSSLLSSVKKVTVNNDLKLNTLKDYIKSKINNPFNADNKKLLIFTAFAETAEYLYANISEYVKKEFGLNTGLVTGSVEGNTTISKLKTDLNTVLTCFSPISKNKEKILPNDNNSLDVLIATDCISEGQNLQDCDCVVNYDIHWNPVRIIQRFGRVDRIGSTNKSIQLVNFWPNIELDEYINLKNRVFTRMKISVMTSTGDDDPINQDESGDLDYRKEQLNRLKTEVVDLEDMGNSISITDLGLNDFRLDLLEYIKDNPEIEKTPFGLNAVTKSNGNCPPGVIFVLKNITNELKQQNKNQLHPYYLVYISDDSQIISSYDNPKEILDSLRSLCKGRSEPIHELCNIFNKETNSGRRMKKYSSLLSDCISNIIDKKEESDIDSLFSSGGTTALNKQIQGLDDFELICFLVIK